jgi:Glycosyl transferase family 2
MIDRHAAPAGASHSDIAHTDRLVAVQPGVAPDEVSAAEPDLLSAHVFRLEWQLMAARIENAKLAIRPNAIERSLCWRASAPVRAITAHYPRANMAICAKLRAAFHAGRYAIRSLKRIAGHDLNRQYARWIAVNDTLSDADRSGIRQAVAAIVEPPMISIIMPVYNTSERLLREAIDSVRAQLYPHWELCIADDASTQPHVTRILDEIDSDARIKIVRRSRNGGIFAASHSALAPAQESFIALMDHDDRLDDSSLRRFIQTYDGAFWIVRPLIKPPARFPCWPRRPRRPLARSPIVA